MGNGINHKKVFFLFLLVFGFQSMGHAETDWEKPTELTESELLIKTSLRGSDIMQMAMFPDGDKIIIALKDGTARIFSIQGKLLETLEGHEEMVTYVSVSPKGDLVATASVDQQIGIWDLHKRKPIQVFTQHKAPVNTVMFSEDGTKAVSASIDGDIRLWNIKTGELIRKFKQPKSNLISAEFSPDGNSILTLQLSVTNKKTGATGAARVFDIKTGQLQSMIPGKPGAYALAFSPVANQVIFAYADKTAQIFDTQNHHRLAKLVGHQGLLTSATFSPDGRWVVTEALDQSSRIWDVQTGKLLYLLKNHQGGLHTSPVFSPDGSKLITINNQGEIRLWQLLDTEDSITI